jgi:hypothetical protein
MRTRSHNIRQALSVAASVLVLVGTALVLAPGQAAALDNGLATTPPMGWNDWNAFGCNVSEQLVEQTANFLATSGLRAAGYDNVNIDDCWLTRNRDTNGNLVPDPVKFPDGITGVANHVHSLGLKLGIYESAGTATCAGYPGSLGHERQDAALFASWGVDYLKYDNCNNQNVPWEQRYDAMRDALAATGRPIVYSLCEWGQDNVWTWGAGTGNLWRTTGDISDSFASMVDIFHQNVQLAGFAGPGHWNDPDMLEIGNGGMSVTEERSEFSLWAEMAAPLIAGTDLTKATPATLATYLNKDVIAVDQDPAGRQGTEIASTGGLDVLAKPLANGDVAVTLFNENATAATISTTAVAAGLPRAPAYRLTDLWRHTGTESAGPISASVPGHGVAMYRVSPLHGLAVDSVPPSTTLAVTGGVPDWSTTGSGPVPVTVTYTDNGLLPAILVDLKLTAPAGWHATATGRTVFPVVLPGRTVSATFTLTPGAPTTPISLDTFTTTATSRWHLSRVTDTSAQTAHVTSPVAAPYRTFTSTTGHFGQLGDAIGIAGSGADTYGSTNEYSAVYRQGAAADGSTATVEVTAQSNTNAWAKAGLMVRDDITGTGSSPGYAIVAVTPGHGYVVQWDSDGDGTLDSNSAPSDTGTGTAVYPSWLKLVRAGDMVTGYYSTDNATWHPLATVTLPGTSATQDIGVFTTAHQSGALGEADFQGFTVTG